MAAKKLRIQEILIIFALLFGGALSAPIAWKNLQMLFMEKTMLNPKVSSIFPSGEELLNCNAPDTFVSSWYQAISENELDKAEQVLTCFSDPNRRMIAEYILVTHSMSQNSPAAVMKMCSQVTEPNLNILVKRCADWAWQQGEMDFVINEDEILLRMTPQDRFVYHQLADAYSVQGKYQDTARIWQALVDYERDHQGILIDDLVSLGSILDGHLDHDQAGQVWQEATRLFPTSEQTWLGLADNVALRKNPVEAFQVAEELLNRFPGNSECTLSAADLYFQFGNMEKATDISESLVESDPQFAGGHFMLGLIFDAQKRMMEAQDQFAKAVELAPRNYSYLYKYAYFIQNNHPQEAIELYQRALALDIPEPEKSWVAEQLQSLMEKTP